MFPDFRYVIEGLFGIDPPQWLSIIKTFGFFVAMAFLAGAWALNRELRRKEAQGLLQPTFSDVETGRPATPNELLWAALTGFLIGYKAGGLFGSWEEAAPNPMGYLFSLQGNVLVGIAGALLAAYSRYAEKRKEQLPEPKIKRVATWPHQRISEIVVLAAIAGLVGAKVFNAFETWDDFLKHPVQNLINSAGLTFYGGLITAAVVIFFYARRHKISFVHLCDAMAPALILAYGIGRLGCQFSGDGDWGIANSAYVTGIDNTLQDARPGEFMPIMQANPGFVQSEYKGFPEIRHAYVPAPAGLPVWMVAQNYPHNVNNTGQLMNGCMGDYCAVLPVAVFPTAMWEAAACVLLFFVLWALRKRIRRPFHLFGIYLVLNGLERFFIEKIRVNYKYDWGFMHPTQAEIISFGLILAGVAILALYRKEPVRTAPVQTPQ